MYRNPLSHPAIVQLDEDDAIEVFQSGIDVIAKMVRDVIAGGNHFHQIRHDYEFFGPGISKVAASVVERDP